MEYGGTLLSIFKYNKANALNPAITSLFQVHGRLALCVHSSCAHDESPLLIFTTFAATSFSEPLSLPNTVLPHAKRVEMIKVRQNNT